MYVLGVEGRAPAWGTQVLKALGSNPAAVYWLLGLCATGVLDLPENREQTGAVFAASPISHFYFTAWSLG